MTVRVPLAAAFVLLFLASSAWASSPAVSLRQQQQLKEMLDAVGAVDLAYLPIYVPPDYVLGPTRGSSEQNGATFVNKKHPTSAALFDPYAIYYLAQPLGASLSTCSQRASAKIQVGDHTVYWNGRDAAWRCVRAPSGHPVRVSATSAKLAQTKDRKSVV